MLWNPTRKTALKSLKCHPHLRRQTSAFVGPLFLEHKQPLLLSRDSGMACGCTNAHVQGVLVVGHRFRDIRMQLLQIGYWPHHRSSREQRSVGGHETCCCILKDEAKNRTPQRSPLVPGARQASSLSIAALGCHAHVTPYSDASLDQTSLASSDATLTLDPVVWQREGLGDFEKFEQKN